MPTKTCLATLFIWTERMISRLVRFHALARNEILWAWIPESDRLQVTTATYSKESSYLPGGAFFSEGLFSWELSAIESDTFPKSGKVLLTAAGGGREFLALCEMGFQVLAFEPCIDFARSTQAIAKNFPGSCCYQACYRDLIDAVRHGHGPLGEVLRNAHVDAVILGWGSFSHITNEFERRELFSSLKTICPQGPVLMSFLTPAKIQSGRIEKLSPIFRKMNAFLGAPSSAGSNDVFLPGGGFHHLVTPEELKDLAQSAGYRVHKGDISPYPHAILVPSNR